MRAGRSLSRDGRDERRCENGGGCSCAQKAGLNRQGKRDFESDRDTKGLGKTRESGRAVLRQGLEGGGWSPEGGLKVKAGV